MEGYIVLFISLQLLHRYIGFVLELCNPINFCIYSVTNASPYVLMYTTLHIPKYYCNFRFNLY